ncbi:UDP-N-acetylmuramyl tripeptide synthase [Congregibacter litoralis KT71]|uniref:UDP-N-acetylmuramyl tripeptide synthase n=2 Tax=Congregibacter TaxID=393661 RepID=A4AE04_9GAMM|nr:UDP-N-acetylmuramyl tripeptide synthase [Congregibacter litoralis KT71]
MRLLDSRRLTGANFLLRRPGAVMDIAVDDREREVLIAAWRLHARRLLEQLDWDDEELAVRPFEGGVSLGLSAPVDGLYTATELNETAYEAARDWIEGGQRHLLNRAARSLRGEYRDEERPRLQRVLAAAREHGAPVVLDEDVLTLGTGRHSQSWDLFELPHPDDVSWRGLKAVPTALITGTNGKTTTVRLLASIAKTAGQVAGVSSTDWLAMGDELLHRDDYAGPGGARIVLRDQRCELALLETARGGLLRRGLAVARADVALITNIAADHLGDFGVETLEDLADVKWSVTAALDKKSSLVLNAEDPLLMARAASASAPLCLFSLSPSAPAFKTHVEKGGKGFTLRRGRLERIEGGVGKSFLSAKKMPLSYGGVARHNIANALAAAAVADALGMDLEVIARGLCALGNEDNPGRANLYTVGGATFLVDFAHNPAGLEALMPMVEGLPARRRALITGQAGDRGDEDIRAFADASAALHFDRIWLKRMDGHARGRAEGEVARIMRDAFIEQGHSAKSISLSKTELDATRAALRWAKPGDLVVLLSHEKRDKTRELIESRIARGTDGCT